METIDGKTYLTVAEYAAMMGVTRRTVYRWTHDTELMSHVITRNKQTFIDVAAILSAGMGGNGVTPSHPDTPENVADVTPDVTPPETVTDALAQVLREEITLLRDQLAAKDAEISRLHEEIDKLQTLLDQAHQLLAMRDTPALEEPRRRRWRRR